MHGHELQEFLFMVINFVILFGALYIFAGKMVKAKFRGRADKIREDLDSSQQAASEAQEILSSVSQVDQTAAGEKEKLYAEAKEMMTAESEQSVRKCQEEKEGILQDARDVARQMAAGMHGRVYLRAIDRLADCTGNLLSDERFAQAREQMQAKFAQTVEPLVKPARSDLVRMSENRPVDVLISADHPVDSSCEKEIFDLVADHFIEYEYDTDPDLGADIQISYGDMVYQGTVESILAQLQ